MLNRNRKGDEEAITVSAGPSACQALESDSDGPQSDFPSTPTDQTPISEESQASISSPPSQHVAEAEGSPQRASAFSIKAPEPWIWKHYGRNLVTKITPWPFVSSKKRSQQSFEVNIAEVQRIYLVELRIRLARHIAEWQRNGTMDFRTDANRKAGKATNHQDDGLVQDEGCWENDLRQYVQALQDYDYMDKCSQTLSRDPFRLTGTTRLDRIILDSALGDAKTWGESNSKQPKYVRSWEGKYRPIVRSRTDNWYKRLFGRLFVSVIGAGFLIGPMWLMMLMTGLYVALISTSVFVLVFGSIMACVLDEHIQVLSSTAAYAAVLVVFVGLTSEAKDTK